MALLDDNDGRRESLLSDIVEEALKDPPKQDSDGPSDPLWLRWIESIMLIIAPAIVFGLAFAFYDYIAQFSAKYHSEQEHAKQRVQNDTMAAFQMRFIIGACVGGALGAVYVVRRIVRKVDL